MHKIQPINQKDFEIGGGEPIYPSFFIKETDLPDIKDKKLDDEFEIRLKVAVREIRKMRAGDIQVEVETREIGLGK